jgi:HPt (histidine-containing phosphotransfer) domain-containing protein
VLDPEVVSRLERLGDTAGDGLMSGLARLFLTDAAVQMMGIQNALAQDDVAAVDRSAHRLSGASANLGAVRLADLCGTLATEAAAGGVADGPATLALIGAELDRVRVALQTTPWAA